MTKDAIIVCSGRLSHDMTLDPESKLRLNGAIRLFNDGASEHIIMNGGPGVYIKPDGSFGYFERGTRPVHCDFMADYAAEMGIPQDRILKQDYTVDSVGEAYYVKMMCLEPKEWKNNIVVSSDYHMNRLRIIYERIFGPEYATEFVGVDTDLTNDEKTLGMEEASLAVFLEQFGEIEPGDSEEIEQTLYTRHGLYVKIPRDQRLLYYPDE